MRPAAPSSNVRRARTARALVAALIGTVHVFLRRGRRRSTAKLPALRRRRGQRDGTERRERRRAAWPARDPRLGAAHGSLSADGDRQPERCRREHRGDRGSGRDAEHAPGRTCAPLQRTSFVPAPGVALSASRCPEFHVVVQLVLQEPGHVGGHRAGPGDRDRERRLAVEPHEPRRVLRIRPAARVTVVVVPARIEELRGERLAPIAGNMRSVSSSHVCPLFSSARSFGAARETAPNVCSTSCAVTAAVETPTQAR